MRWVGSVPPRRHRSAVAALLCAVALAVAARPARGQALATRVYTEADGLPSTTVYDVAQGPDGRLWFATRSGIAVYDGARWQHFGVEEGLPGATQRFVRTDAHNNIWAIAADRVAVARLDAEDAAREPADAPTRAGARWHTTDLSPASAGGAVLPGRVLVTAAGLLQQGDRVTLAIALAGGHLFVLEGGDLHAVAFGEAVRFVYSIVPRGDIFLLATDAGVYRLAPDDTVASRVPTNLPEPVYALYRDPLTGIDWSVGHGVVRAALPGGEERRFRWPADAGYDARSFAIAGDRYGGLYFGTFADLFYLPADAAPGVQARRLDRNDGLASGGSNGLLRDREGNVWVAAARGVTKIFSRRLVVYDRRHGLPRDEVTAVTQLPDGMIVLGAPGAVSFLEPGGRTPRVAVELGPDAQDGRVLDLAVADEQAVWLAANRLGLLRVDRAGRVRRVATPSPVITAVWADPAGTLWLGSLDGLLRGRPGRFAAVPLPAPRAQQPYVRRIVPAGSDTVLVATDSAGVFRIGPRGIRHFAGGSATLANVYAAAEIDGKVWLGTAAGLAELRGSRIEPSREPAIDRPVYFVLPDRRGGIWFGTDRGAARWNGRELRWLELADGLPALETNRAGGFEDADGHVWIGTAAGVAVYRPEYDLPTLAAPLLAITATESASGPLPPGASVSADNGLLRYRVRAISFVDERRVLFRHRLEGTGEEWSEWYPLLERELEFPRLAPGRYRLHLQAAAVDGRTSREVTSAWAIVRTPLWRRPWVLALLVVLAAAAVYTGAALRTEHRLRLSLERQVDRRLQEQRALLRELQRSHHVEALGALAGGLAHDFNNLLAAILGNLSLLELDAPETGPGRQEIEEAKQAVARARALTQQLLTFAKGGEPSRTPTDLTGLVRSSADIVLSGSGIDARIRLDPELWLVDADSRQIGQVLDNLLINAREAMPDGGTIRVTAHNRTCAPGILPHGRYVHVQVADEGPGIAAEELDRIFDPYFSTKPGGKGLGLAIAESIVSRHGGRLEVRSEPGRGTVFELWLPAAPPGPVAPRSDAPRRSARLLVMDDEPALRHVVARMLAHLGYEAACARDGEEALRIFLEGAARERPFAAALLDLTIPGGMGGAETARRLREIDPGLPIAVMTGYAEPVAGVAAGRFQARLQKPFEAEDLERLLAELLDGATTMHVEG